MYNIVETFTSIQGEGSWSGEPATFIRFFGCNLSCSFCDEPLHKNKVNITKMSQEDILKICYANNIVITGGEPSLQDLNQLIKFLQSRGKKVAVETNGYSYQNISCADLHTLSPKKKQRPKGKWDDVKLLVEWSKNYKEEIEYWKQQNSRVFLSGINYEKELNKDNNLYAYDLCLKYNCTLNIQLHKIIGVR